MDRRRDRGDLVLSAGAALALVATLALVFSDLSPHQHGAADGTPAIGRVDGRSGEVRRRIEGTLVWGTIDQGDPLYEGDAVWVAEDGAASLSLGGGGRLDVAPASLVVLHSPGREALELVEGGALG